MLKQLTLVLKMILGLIILAMALKANASVIYNYDAVGRLTLVDYGGGNTQVYSYDSAGNIAEVKSTTTTDTTPDAFSFTAQTNVARSTLVTSAPVAITGINAATNWSVTNGTACVGSSAANCGCADSAFTTSGTVSNNQYVCARHTSSASYATKTTTTVTVGGVSSNFESTTVAQNIVIDTTPDTFIFNAQTNLALSSTAESNVITVKGINTAAPISITTNGFYRINGGTYINTAGKVNNGDTVQVKHTTANIVNTSVSTTLTIGGVSGVFKTTTATTKDTTPDAFNFTAKTGVALSSNVESDIIKISGINAPTPISVSSGSYYRINGGSYVNTAGTVNNGDTVQVKHAASATNNTAVTTTLTIGGVTGLFKSTTVNVALTAPQNVVATADNGKVTLSWNAVTGATSYDVCRAQVSISNITNCTAFTGGTWHINANSPATIMGLTNGTTYYFRVIAKNATSTSPASTEVTATPTSSTPAPSLSIKFDQASLDSLGATYFGTHEIVKGYDGAANAVKFYGTGKPGNIRIPKRAEMQFTNAATFDVWTRIDSSTGMNGYGNAATTAWAMAVLAKSHDRTGAALNTSPSPTGVGYGWAGMSTFDSTWQDANCQITKKDFNVPLNTWFRLTEVISSTGGITAYVNKQLAYTCPNARPSFTAMNQQDLYIGQYGDNFWYPLNGAVQNLNIYKQALTKSQVEALPQAEPPKPDLIIVGAWEQLEGKPFDVVMNGSDAGNISSLTAGSNVCLLNLSRSDANTKFYTCTTPSANGSDQAPFTLTAIINGKTQPWTVTGYTSSAKYWATYNGVPYVIGLNKYITTNGNGIGPTFTISMGSTSGKTMDLPAASYFSSLRLNNYICPKIPTLDWIYQCPTLPVGNYVVNILHDSDKRYLVGNSFIVKVQ